MSTSERQDVPSRDALDSGRAGALHRLTGAAPVCAALLVLAVLAALVSPAVRHGLSTTFQRRPERYLELYFTSPTQAATCGTVNGQLTVRATVRSHLADHADVRYAVALTSAGHVVTSVDGTVATVPDRTADFGATLTVPLGNYGVAVTLIGRSQHLALHCATGG